VQYASRMSVQSYPLEVIEVLENRCVVHAYHLHHTEHNLYWAPVRAVRRDHGQTPQAYIVLSRCAAPSLSFCSRLTRSRAGGISEGEFEATLSEGLPASEVCTHSLRTPLLLTPAPRRCFRATELQPYHHAHRRWQRPQICLFHRGLRCQRWTATPQP
jgi:hypothetical protein